MRYKTIWSTILASTDDESSEKLEDKLTLIWLDRRLHRDNDNLHSMTQLCQVIQSIRTFTESDSCLLHLTYQSEGEKIILLVSGSLGEELVPMIHSFPHVDSIYVFCIDKIKHQQWAKHWNKVRGVFTDIQSVCHNLKQNYSPRYRTLSTKTKPLNYIERLIDSEEQSQEEKNEFLFHYPEDNASSVCHREDQDEEEVNKAIKHFSIDCITNSGEENEIVRQSQSVTPYVEESKRDFLPTDVWSNLLWIENSMSMRNRFEEVRRLVLRADRMSSVDECLNHVTNHRNGIYFIVLCHLDNLQSSLSSICCQEQVRRVYLHGSMQSLREYQSLINRYSRIVSILQHSETLIHMILWDMSVSTVELAEHYEKDRQNDLAKERYQYAVLLQTNIERNLQKRDKFN